MNNQIPNHAEQEREKLKTLLRTAFLRFNNVGNIADYLLDNGVMVSFMPVKKQNYRIEIAKVEVLDDGEMPVGFVHSLMINKLIEELRENVAKKVIISYEEGVYRAELPVIVPNEKESF